MSTKSVIECYLEALRNKSGWSDFFRDDMTFVSHVVPLKRVAGRAAFLESTRRFYSMIAGVEVIALIVEEDRACALTRYQLQIPHGPSFGSEVAEIFKVTDGKIASLDIYFDSSPFPK
jgi:ketosteroid isomerase-like protein